MGANSGQQRPFITRERRGRKRQRYVHSYRPDEEEIEALRIINERWEPEHHYKATLERTWEYNIAFLLGYQWHTWNERQWGLVTRPRSKRWRVRETRNLIRPHIERLIANLTAYEPRFIGAPNSNEIEDEEAARLGEKVLKHYWSKLDMTSKKEELAYWMSTCGTAFIKTYWDPHEGERFLVPMSGPDGMPQMDHLGRMIEHPIHTGDIISRVISPFQIHTDPLATSDEEVQWLLDVSMRPLDWVDEHFPEKAPFVESDYSTEDRQRSQRSILNVLGPRAGGWGHTAGEHTSHDWVTIKEYWERPSQMYPRGRLGIEANGVMLRVGDNPTPGHGIPYTRFQSLPVPGRYWGQSVIENLITPQRNYNKLVSKRLEHNFMVGMSAKILFPSMSGIPNSAFVSDVGEVVKYDGVQPPSYLAPPPLPPESDTEMNRLRGDFDHIAQSYGVDRGQYQGKLSGSAISLLIEQNLKGREPQIRRMAKGFETWGKLVLELIQANMDDQRVIKIAGRENSFEVSAFRGADLRGNTDVHIETESMMPKSRTLAYQELQILTQSQLFNPMSPEHRKAAFKMIDVEDPETAAEDLDVYRREAQLEDRLMFQGQPVEPAQFFQDQDIHVAQHRGSMASDEFRMAPPEIKALFYHHMQTHHEITMPNPGVTLDPEMLDQAAAEPVAAGAGSQENR